MLNVTDLFMKIIQIDSVSGEEAEMAAYLMDFLSHECNLEPEIDKYNNVFVRTKGTGKPLLFTAHLDTVQPGIGIVPNLENGKITSQGDTILGADNKASVSAIMSAVKYIVKNPELNWRPLDILFTTWEEDGCYGAIGFDKSKIRANIGYLFDGTGKIGDIIYSSPSYARFNITIKGLSAHTEDLHEAIPAIPVALKLIKFIESLRSTKVLINIGKIKAGTARNTIIGTIELQGEIRSVYDNQFQETINKLKDKLNNNYVCKINSEIVIENPGYVLKKSEINPVKKRLEKLLNKEIAVHESFGVSDANILNNYSNKLKVFNLGDESLNVHTKRESTTVVALETMRDLILKLAKNEE